MNIVLGTHPDCVEAPECDQLAQPLHKQLSTGAYDFPASVFTLDDFNTYLASHRTARKRAQRCRNLGYTFAPIRRELHEDEIHGINTSLPERQGRPMSAGYVTRPTFSPLPDYPCRRHRIDTYGVFAPKVSEKPSTKCPKNPLVAYIVVYVCGDLAMVSQILGHADHLANDVMYLLTVEAFRDTLERSGQVTAFYNRHDSGTDGLRYFKERLGFAAARVKWCQ